jgi:hypothetical protein
MSIITNTFNARAGIDMEDELVAYLKKTFEECLKTPYDWKTVSDITTEAAAGGGSSFKNIYINLSGNGEAFHSKVIKSFTKSIFSHSSLGLHSDGTFYAMSNQGPGGLFGKDALVKENYNTMDKLSKNQYLYYNVYKLTVVERSYETVKENIQKALSQSHRYSIPTILADGIKILLKNKVGIELNRYKQNQLQYLNLVCSGFVAQMLCKSLNTINEWFKKNDLSVTGISPQSITDIPGVKFLFKGNSHYPFVKWRNLYEKKHGVLPN